MEGPSLVILREELEPFLRHKVLEVAGNTKQPKESLKGRRLEGIDTWGKALFLNFSSARRSVPPIVVKTHFLMFGSYRINEERPERSPRLKLRFSNGVVYFYSCSIKFGAEEYFRSLDPQVDLMSQHWSEEHVVDLMGRKKDDYLCDLFLDQKVFAGSGNIVKNEVLFNIRRHPLTKLSQLAARDWPMLARAVHSYCWNFYEWKRKFELRKHWQVYRRSKCPLCSLKLTTEKLGRFHRKTFYCPRHQVLSKRVRKLSVFPVLPIAPSAQPEPRLDH
jgi:endonuclease-8